MVSRKEKASKKKASKTDGPKVGDHVADNGEGPRRTRSSPLSGKQAEGASPESSSDTESETETSAFVTIPKRTESRFLGSMWQKVALLVVLLILGSGMYYIGPLFLVTLDAWSVIDPVTCFLENGNSSCGDEEKGDTKLDEIDEDAAFDEAPPNAATPKGKAKGGAKQPGVSNGEADMEETKVENSKSTDKNDGSRRNVEEEEKGKLQPAGGKDDTDKSENNPPKPKRKKERHEEVTPVPKETSRKVFHRHCSSTKVNKGAEKLTDPECSGKTVWAQCKYFDLEGDTHEDGECRQISWRKSRITVRDLVHCSCRPHGNN
ncbi:unnamed protein product [Amoebophrya sp. A25]|nr:unnamed protein product [Amoebophrya sp. A25]|eukprot:GSA25T00003182001.1